MFVKGAPRAPFFMLTCGEEGIPVTVSGEMSDDPSSRTAREMKFQERPIRDPDNRPRSGDIISQGRIRMKKHIQYIALVAVLCTTPVHAGFLSTMAEMVGLKARPTFQNINGKEVGWFRDTVKSVADLEESLTTAKVQVTLSDGKTKIPFRSFKDGVFVLVWNKEKNPRMGLKQMTLTERVTKEGKVKTYTLPFSKDVKHGFRVFYGTPHDTHIQKFLKNERKR